MRTSVLFIDEFASVLDRATARALCIALARLTRAISTNRSISVVLATAHDDVREWLAPDSVVSLGSGGRFRLKAINNTSNKVSEGFNRTQVVHARRTNAKQSSNAGPSCDFSVRVLEGDERSATLARFASLHYRAGLPSTCIRVLAACDAVDNVAGILCISMPALNAPWRARAWPELFGSLSHTSNVATVNLYVRAISRVIVAPTYRGSGIASLLIRAYLDNPLTPLTETLAAFGRFSPLFERCGMRRINFPASRRDTTLAKALRDRRIVPWKLVSLDEATRVLEQDPALRCAVLAWARGSKSTRRFAHERTPKLNRLLVLAAAGLVARPAAFVAP